LAISLGNLVASARLLLELPSFVRQPVGLEEARTVLRRRLATRPADLLAVARRAAYDRPGSVYQRLLAAAGCEYGDLERLVRSEGVEGALEQLLRNGVYLTVDEFKGRRPVVRGSLCFEVDPRQLRNHLAVGQIAAQTGGSRGTPSPAPIDLSCLRDWAVNIRFELAARGEHAWAPARWTIPGGVAMVGILTFYAACGVPLERWFSPLDPSSPDLPPRYGRSIRLLRWGSRLGGLVVPAPEHVSLEEPGPIVDWLAEVLRSGKAPFLVAYASSLVRLAQAAQARGTDLSGTHALGIGEPLTATRRAAIQQVGIEVSARYASMEVGPIGSGCLAPLAADDLHLFHDLLALVQPPGREGQSRPLFVSTIRLTAPYLLLNVSLGDEAVLANRSCGCPLGQAGRPTQLQAIRSFEKLTVGGMSFLDTDLVRVLEQVLPGRFGGAPTDYQLVEQEGEAGRPQLRLLVHPALGSLDPETVRTAFLDAIGVGSSARGVMSLTWRQAGLPRVERRAPIATPSGKILHLHVTSADLKADSVSGVATGRAAAPAGSRIDRAG
jgi:hypothetical protein